MWVVGVGKRFAQEAVQLESARNPGVLISHKSEDTGGGANSGHNVPQQAITGMDIFPRASYRKGERVETLDEIVARPV